MPIYRILTFAISLLLATQAGAQTLLGPFVPKPALTVYVVGDGKPATARVTIKRFPPSLEDRIMFRVFDPEEKLIFKEHREPYSTTPDPWLDQTVDLPASGVYQIRVTSGNSRSGSAVSSVGVTLSRSLHWGVSFQNGTYSGWLNQPDKLYAYVPPKTETFQFGFLSGGVEIKDGDKRVPIDFPTGKDPKTEKIVVDVPRRCEPKGSNVIWTFTFSAPANWSFRAADFPLILCPTPQAAVGIGASVEVTSDETVLTHKFQH